MQAVILAAGKGTRLQPLTLSRSKAMVPVAGQPLVERVLATLAPAAHDEIIVVIGPEDRAIREHFSREAGRSVHLPVRLVVQTERLGMAKALALAAPYLHGPFILSACDNLTSVEHVAELVATHERMGAAATLSLMPVEPAEVSKTGIVVWEAPYVRRIVEKPRLEEAPSTIASLPLYVFSPEVLDYLPQVQPSPRGEYELQDAIQMLIQQTGRVTGVFTPTRRQVTNAADLLALNLAYLDELALAEVDATAQVGPEVRLTPPYLIGPGAVIEAGARIGPRVYLEGECQIGAGATLQDTVVLRGRSVAAGAEVSQSIIG